MNEQPPIVEVAALAERAARSAWGTALGWAVGFVLRTAQAAFESGLRALWQTGVVVVAGVTGFRIVSERDSDSALGAAINLILPDGITDGLDQFVRILPLLQQALERYVATP